MDVREDNVIVTSPITNEKSIALSYMRRDNTLYWGTDSPINLVSDGQRVTAKVAGRIHLISGDYRHQFEAVSRNSDFEMKMDFFGLCKLSPKR